MENTLFNLSDFHTIVFDFDGVFTDNNVYLDENSIESVKLSRADGYAINLLRSFCQMKNLNIELLILSTETNKVVAARAQKLNLECIQGERNKLMTLTKRFDQRRPKDLDPFSGLIYFGNDLNDLHVMLKAGIGISPSDAHPKVKEISTFVVNRHGGKGFVREGVEFLIGLKSMSTGELNELISNS